MGYARLEGQEAEESFRIKPGALIEDQYVLDRRIGIGEFAAVYECHRKDRPDKRYALKVLFPAYVRDQYVFERFRRESILALTLAHPNVIRVDDFFHTDKFTGYLMEYAEGGDLRQRLDQNVVLPHDRIIRICKEICAGLCAIHKRGIVHRDLKPENILFAGDGTAKLSDFSIAHSGDAKRLTMHGSVLCTVAYVSPEYLLSGQLDERADIYSLGAVAYEMLTGKVPFAECTATLDALTARIGQQPSPPYSIRTDCPVSLNAAVMRALDHEPSRRFQTAQEMLAAFEAISAELGQEKFEAIERARTEIKTRPGAAEKRERLPSSEPATFSRIAAAQPKLSVVPGGRKKWVLRDWRPIAGVSLCLCVGAVLALYSYPLQLSEPWQANASLPAATDSVIDSATDAQVAPSAENEGEVLEENKAKVQSVLERVGLELEAQAVENTAGAGTADSAGKSEQSAASEFDLYTVSAGDTLLKIAKKFNVNPKQIVAVNELSDPNTVMLGMPLRIPRN